MSKLQESLDSSSAVYAGGSGLVPIPEFDPADEFIPDGVESGLIDGDDVPVPPVEDAPAPVDETPQPEVPSEPGAPAAPEPEAPVVPEPEVAPETPVSTEPPVRNKQDFLHRLNAKNKKLSEKDARIAELESRLNGTPSASAPAPAAAAAPALNAEALIPNLEARRQEILDLTIDGRTAEAAALQSRLDAEMTQAIVTATTQQVMATIRETNRVETIQSVVSDLAATYEELDQAGDAYDSKAARMINAVAADYVESGHSEPEALRLAADEVMRLRYPGYFEAPPPVVTPAAPTAPAAKPSTQKSVVAKAAAAASAQPSLPVGGSNPRSVAAAPIDVFSMSDEEFAKLTPAQISELRGDNL